MLGKFVSMFLERSPRFGQKVAADIGLARQDLRSVQSRFAGESDLARLSLATTAAEILEILSDRLRTPEGDVSKLQNVPWPEMVRLRDDMTRSMEKGGELAKSPSETARASAGRLVFVSLVFYHLTVMRMIQREGPRDHREGSAPTRGVSPQA